LRAPRASEAEIIQAVWEGSHTEDDPAGRPRGGWSVDGWATDSAALLLGDQVVGVAAVRAEASETDVVGARIALEPTHREPSLSGMLVDAALDLARASGGRVVRLFLPARALWAEPAVCAASFTPVRSIYHMLLPAAVPLSAYELPENVRIRPMHSGEDAAVLDALNRNWADTWGFQPITADMLALDLQGQQEGMLLAVDSSDDARILATCHAVFDTSDTNPDGAPRAWISNLTVDPEARGKGLGRTMLLAGLAFLRDRGAGSITLGVDAGDPAPLRLYLSVGFEALSSVQAWDKPLRDQQ
jgi:mycothiol synthase